MQIRNVCKIALFKIIGLPITIDIHAIQEKVRETIDLYHTIIRGHINNEI